MKFFNRYLDKIYKYIYIHDEQTILIQDMVRDLEISKSTIYKYLRWLEKRELIEKKRKYFRILPT